MRIKPQQSRDDGDKSKSVHHNKPKKEFKLPKKDAEGQAQLSTQQGQTTQEGVETSEVKGQTIQSVQQVENVKAAILKMVDSMQVGKVGETSLLTAQLKNDQSVHQALRGAEVRLEMTNDGLKVHIEPVDGQKDMAQALIAQHQDQVAKLQESLAMKNIHLQHLQVGNHVVDLPHEKVLSPNELFSGQQLDQGKRDGKDEGPPERIDPTEKNSE
ncbi:MAG: hypothetical protein S4CHLAM81_14770 [Chlamydiales bacterium]|nr:hypothetical protein [Chlamydiales bacterium]MCH9636246.1 hypothetical protein [Chlamydiales bacterium]MCH9704414.1 DUF5421 family protein [Chlamydiota bacterium]